MVVRIDLPPDHPRRVITIPGQVGSNSIVDTYMYRTHLHNNNADIIAQAYNVTYLMMSQMSRVTRLCCSPQCLVRKRGLIPLRRFCWI